MKIIVVDDSRATQVIVRRIIHELPYEGIQIANADNGASGLELIRTWEPDLIISDWHMPEMDGMEMLDAINREMLGIPFGFISTDGSDEKKTLAFKQGATFYIQKPFSKEELQNALEPLFSIHFNKPIHPITDNKFSAASFSPEKIETLIKLIRDFTNNIATVKPTNPDYFQREQYPCVLALFESESDHGIKALTLFDHNASSIIENSLNINLLKDNAIQKNTIGNKTVTQCKLLSNNINRSVLTSSDIEPFHLRKISIIDDKFDLIESLMKKSWKNRIDLSIQFNHQATGVLTLISS